jgi:hypothetical protein
MPDFVLHCFHGDRLNGDRFRVDAGKASSEITIEGDKWFKSFTTIG